MALEVLLLALFRWRESVYVWIDNITSSGTREQMREIVSTINFHLSTTYEEMMSLGTCIDLVALARI
jgi:hypothetical protein